MIGVVVWRALNIGRFTVLMCKGLHCVVLRRVALCVMLSFVSWWCIVV